jgi:hypothetical protein
MFECGRDGAEIEKSGMYLTRRWCPDDYGCCVGLAGKTKQNDTQTWESIWRAEYAPPLTPECHATRPASFVSQCFKQPYKDELIRDASNTAYVFPEMHDDNYKVKRDMEHLNFESVGLAYSGGGRRTYAAMIGYLRALTKWKTQAYNYEDGTYREVSYNDAVSYISTCSGGSWFHATFEYAKAANPQNTNESLLGESQFDVYEQKNNPNYRREYFNVASDYSKNAMAFAISKFTYSNIAFNWLNWSKAINSAFLEPFGITGDPAQYPASKPFWIANGVILDLTTADVYPQLQFTPMYSGVTQHHIIKVTTNEDLGGGPARVTFIRIGGVWVESKHFNSGAQIYQGKTLETYGYENMAMNLCAPATGYIGGDAFLCKAESTYLGGDVDQTPSIGEHKAITQLTSSSSIKIGTRNDNTSNSNTFQVKDMIGISSMAVAARFYNFGLPSFYKAVLGSPIQADNSPIDPSTFNLGDGGFIDNLALLPLVQRRVRHIIAFWNIDRNIDFSTVPSSEGGCQWMPDICPYFGIWNADPKLCDSELKNANAMKKLQIFNTSNFYTVWSDLKRRKESGTGPVWSRQTLRVLPNDAYGIAGNYDVDLLLIMLQPCPAFPYNKLVEEVIGPSTKFPNYETFTLLPPNAEIGLDVQHTQALALFTEWCLYDSELKAQIDSMFPHAYSCNPGSNLEGGDTLSLQRNFCNPDNQVHAECCDALDNEWVTTTTMNEVYCRKHCVNPSNRDACLTTCMNFDDQYNNFIEEYKTGIIPARMWGGSEDMFA